MSKRKRDVLVLAPDEHVVTAYAESAAGPGWANAPVWVIVRGRNGALRQECIQPQDQSEVMVHLYGVSAAAHGAMCRAVERLARVKP